jgi:hypothetical protein
VAQVVLLVTQETQVTLGTPDPQGTQEIMVQAVLAARKVMRVMLVIQVMLVTQASTVTAGQVVTAEVLVIQVHQVMLAPAARVGLVELAGLQLDLIHH